MTKLPFITISMLALPLAASAEGDSPWLPIPGQLSLGVSYTQQTAKETYIGDTKLSISTITGGGASEYKRTTTAVTANYGLYDAISLDATIAYGKVEVGAADDDSGILDTVIGAKWRVLDEVTSPAMPTVTLRVAAIINGNYDGARLAGLGNDASGYELAAIVGKQFNSMFSAWGEYAYQNRNNSVPDATVLDLGVSFTFVPQWNTSLTYTAKRYSGDLDIGGAGFTPARFQEVKDEHNTAKLTVGYAVAGNQGVSLTYGKSVGSGRNTGVEDPIISAAYVYAF